MATQCLKISGRRKDLVPGAYCKLMSSGNATKADGFKQLVLPGTSSSFDAQRYVSMLRAENLNESQSEMLLQLLAGAIDESVQSLQTGVITREEQRINAEAYKEEFKELRKDIDLLGKKDFAILKMELERIIQDVVKLKEGMRGEIGRVLAGVRLDINLEKGRVKDEVAILESKVQSASERIDREVEELRQRLKTIDKDITTTIIRKYDLVDQLTDF